MTSQPAPHDGLGVAQYAWSTSPLRRYADLLNQWQLLAVLADETPPFGQKSDALFAAMRDFDLTYSAYAEFQRGMERYWCLRWLRQEGCSSLLARTLRREELVRVEHLPLVLRVAGLPSLPPGTRISLALEAIDELGLNCRLRFLDTVADDATAEVDADLDDAEGEAA